MDSKALRQGSRLLVSFLCVCVTFSLTTWAQSGGGASLIRFPRFVSFSDASSGIALFNPSMREATVELTLRRPDGTPVSVVTNPVSTTIPPLGQIARTAAELFGSVGGLDASLDISSATPGIVAYYQTFDSASTFLDGVDAPASATNLVFPVVPGPGEGVSEIDILNPTPRAASVELKLWSFDGMLLGRSVILVPASGFYRNLSEDLFPAGTSFAGASHITAASRGANVFAQSQPVAGTSIFAGFSSHPSPGGYVDVAALNARTLTETANAGAIPHFRCGGKYAATLAITNVEPAPVDVTVTAVDGAGTAIGNRTLNLKANGGIRAPLQNIINELGSAEREGWLVFQATGRITCALIYGRNDTGSLSAIPVQKSPKVEFAFPQIVQGSGYYTTVSLANPTPFTSRADFYVIGKDGSTSAANQVEVGPGNSLSARLDHLLPEVVDQVGGIVYVQSNEALFATASVWSDDGSLVSSFSPQDALIYPRELSGFAVTGKITLNSHPADGFAVAISGPVSGLATSSEEGYYAFKHLPAGRYSMMVYQPGFQFTPGQTTFEITNASKRQDFQGFTASDAIVVQPASSPAGSPDTKISVFGNDFNGNSVVYAGAARLETTLLDPSLLEATIPSFLMSSASSMEIYVITDDDSPDRRVTRSHPFYIYQDLPALAGIVSPDPILQGNPGTSIKLTGSGFLPEARIKVNGISEDIQANVLSEKEIVAYLPARCFEKGGVFPVTVENPFPANAESNVLLMTVYYPAPTVEAVLPSSTPARLEPGAGAFEMEVFGYGFRRGSVVLLNGQALVTTYCEKDPYCLSVHLYAKVPAELLRTAGFANVVVRNPDPSVAGSNAAILRVDGLRPTITSVLPGSATAVGLTEDYAMPVLVSGTNFGPETVARIYKADQAAGDYSTSEVEVLSSTQLLISMRVGLSTALGEWNVQVANPPPGGGESETVIFFLNPGSFVANPFLIELSPQTVAAGGPAFTLTVNGTNFADGAVICFHTTTLPTTFISDRQLRAVVPARLIQWAGRFPVSVTNPDEGGTSNRIFLDVR